MRITEILAEGDLKEFDPGPNGPGPFKIYIEKYYIGKLFPTFDEALEEVEFLRDADPKSSTHNWRIVDGTGKTVWEYDIGDDIDAQRRANKIQFGKSGGQGMAEAQDWQGNRGSVQAQSTDHTLEEAEQYVKTNYPVFKKYRVRRAEPGFRAYSDPSHFARSHAHVHDVDSAMDYLQLQENPVMSGSWQHSYSIGYSWHTNENRSSGIAVLYYEDRGMGSDEIIVAAKDRQNLAAAVAVFRDAGVVPQLKKKGVTEATGDNKFDAMMGTMQGNAELLKSVMSEFLTIYYGALDEEDMTDHIAYNLGDFFNGVKRSRDPVLQKSYAYVRDLAEEDVDVQANGTLRAIRMMLGDPAYTPPPKPPMSAADQVWVDRLVNAMTTALASHGIKAHPNWNKKT